MQINRRQFTQKLSYVMLVTVTFIVSGLGCFLCAAFCATEPVCSMAGQSQPTVANPVSECAGEEAAGPECSAHSCCSEAPESPASCGETENGDGNTSAGVVPVLSAPQSDCGIGCCGPFPILGDETLLTRTVQPPAADAPVLQIASALGEIAPKTGFPAKIFHPNRGHTYLKCCVFLI